jgi:hypothetical protein
MESFIRLDRPETDLFFQLLINREEKKDINENEE